MIQNTFIITPKDEWRDEACYMRAEYAAGMEFALPEKYRPLFANLIKDISLNDLMDNRDHKRAYDIMAQAMVSGTEGVWYSPHGDCLLHVLRKTFYNTLLIIHGDYNPFKYDYCIVPHGHQDSRSPDNRQGWIQKSQGNGCTQERKESSL